MCKCKILSINPKTEVKTLTLTLLILLSKFCIGQKSNEPYQTFPSDSSHENFLLTLVNDSIVEFQNIRRHMSPRFKSSFRYITTDTTITILYDTFSVRDIFYKSPYMSKYFSQNKINLTKIKNGFIDSLNSVLYLRQSILPKNPDLFYFIDDKMYRQDLAITDGYGIIRKSPKTNKRLQKKLKLVRKNIDNYSLEHLKGLKAYQKFGIKQVFGVIVLTLVSKNKIVGNYIDYFGSRIQLNADKTFKYSWHIHMSSSWTKGTWTAAGDTIYFDMVPTYDTLSRANSNGSISDTLILSTDETPERFTQAQFAALLLSSQSQGIKNYPEKLFFRKDRLYNIQNGKLVAKKQKGFWTSKKFVPWFFRYDEE